MSLFRKKKKEVDAASLLKDYRKQALSKKALSGDKDTKALRRIFEALLFSTLLSSSKEFIY